MTHGYSFAGLALLLTYLVLFFWAGRMASHAAGVRIWLFGLATGRARWAAIGFRLSFVLAALGLIWGAIHPAFHHNDEGNAVLGLFGLTLANAGAMLAFGAQLSMAASWRVGVQTGAVGPLVAGGLFAYSRNPTFVGQGMLLLGAVFAAPTVLGMLGFVLFAWSATTQIITEEAVLAAEHGADYADFAAKTPRWFKMGR